MTGESRLPAVGAVGSGHIPAPLSVVLRPSQLLPLSCSCNVMAHSVVSYCSSPPLACRYVFPKDQPGWRSRVGVALGLLLGSKLLNIQVRAAPGTGAQPLPSQLPPAPRGLCEEAPACPLVNPTSLCHPVLVLAMARFSTWASGRRTQAWCEVLSCLTRCLLPSACFHALRCPSCSSTQLTAWRPIPPPSPPRRWRAFWRSRRRR